MKKTLLMAAAALAAGVISSQAQVYSLNIVGYVNVAAQVGNFTLISNPLNAPTNTLANLIPNPPPGSQFFKYTTGSGYTTYTFDDFDLVWLPNDVAFAPGEGGFLKVKSNYTNTFVGNALTGSQTNNIPAGYAMVSCKIPVGGSVTNSLVNFPASAGDQLFKYTPGLGWTTYTFDDFDLVWLPSVPTISVGEALFSLKSGSAQWIQTVNP